MLINVSFTNITDSVCPHASTAAGLDTSYILSSPGSNITALSRLNFKNESLTSEQVLLDYSAIPVGNPNNRDPHEEVIAEFSTMSSALTQTEGSSLNSHSKEMSEMQTGNLSPGFDGDTVTSIDATGTDLSLHTTVAHKQEDLQFNSARENSDQQNQRKLKWIW